MPDRYLNWRLAFALAIWALPGAVGAAGMGGVLPDGAELDIDGPEDGGPAGIARLADGGFVLGWAVGGGAGGVFRAQRFDAARRPLGSSLQLACTEGVACYVGEIVGDATGGYWAAWVESDPWGRAFLRKFSAAGEPLTPAIDLGVPTGNRASTQPRLAAPLGGGVLAIWTMAGWETEGFFLELELQARRFAADGTPSGATRTLNVLPLPVVFDKDAAASPSGGFVVVWSGVEELPDGSYRTPVRFRLLDEQGMPLGPPRRANHFDATELSFPKVASLGGAGFLALWTAGEPPTAHYRLFDWQGEPRTRELTLEPLAGRVEWAEATNTGGAVALVRSSAGVLSAVVFDEDGPAETGTIAAVEASGGSCTAVSDGRFLVSWSVPADGGYDLTAQGFKLLDLFADGFESGNTNRWSSAIP